jgi:hypothetical protein
VVRAKCGGRVVGGAGAVVGRRSVYLCDGGCDDAVLCVVCASEAEGVGAGVMGGPYGSDRRSGARR